MNDPAAYTAKQLRINLSLIQLHMNDLLAEAESKEFCLECVENHLLLIEGLSQEALSFFEEKALFTEMAAWASSAGEKLNEMSKPMATAIREKAREYRKKLTALSSECGPCKRLALKFLEHAEEKPHVMTGSAI